MTGPMNEQREERIAAWLLGELSEVEQRAFEAELAREPSLAREVRAMEEALAMLGTSTPIAPPPALRDRVLSAATAQPAPDQDRAPRPTIAAKAAPWLALALAASVVLAINVKSDAEELRQERDAALTQVDALTGTIASRDSLLARLVDPGTELVTLAATGASAPQIRVLIDRGRQVALLSAAALEAAPAGQEYQLWYIVDGAPVPSQTFVPTADGSVVIASVPIPATGAVQAVAVTLEPTGGSTTPTMPILFVGEVGAE